MLDWITWVSSWPKGPEVLDKEASSAALTALTCFDLHGLAVGLIWNVVTDLETELQ